MMSAEIKVREARSADRAAVLAFTRETFHWGDYVPEVWNDWLGARDGKLLVADVNGKPVGLVHIAFLGSREAWFEGMRVHPRFRKRGVAAQLDSTARRLARAAGCQVVRLETASDNFRAQAALRRFGYRRVLSFRGWKARAKKGEREYSRLARMNDLKDLMRLWEHSAMRRATHSLSPLEDVWHWGRFTSSRFRRGVTAGRVWVIVGQGGARAFAQVREDEEELRTTLLIGRTRDARKLLLDLRASARARGYENCYLTLPDTARFATSASGSGFVPDRGGIFVYEHLLP